MKDVRRDCYFYYEDIDMGARVDNCTFSDDYKFGYCPCEKCTNYISKSKAREIIRKHSLEPYTNTCPLHEYQPSGVKVIDSGETILNEIFPDLKPIQEVKFNIYQRPSTYEVEILDNGNYIVNCVR